MNLEEEYPVLLMWMNVCKDEDHPNGEVWEEC